MNVDVPYPELFSPFELAGKRLRNRIAHASISTGLAQDGRVTERMVQYYANRARGGAALIVAEPFGWAPHQVAPSRVRVWDGSQLDGLSRLASAVEGEDCRLLGQVQDPGRGRHIPGRNPDAIGPSPLPDDLSWTMPREMSIADIERLIEHFAHSSELLKRCGFSGVELSAGHGHLFHQFMSAWSNARVDRYGGDFEGRMRLMVQLIAAIRAACGSDFILGVKLPGDDGVPGGIDIDTACRIGRYLAEHEAIDYYCLAQGSHHRSLELHIPDDHFPRVPFLPLVKAFRREIPDVALMALGRITDPAEAQRIVADGDGDLVALGRALITDPAWPMKAQRGRAGDIRYCVSGNSCWHRVIHHLPLACDNNPLVATPEEVQWEPRRVAQPKHVVVVGAGVAGLEAAWTAAARGHRVTVLGRSPYVGGKARLHASLPGSESISSVYDYQFMMAQRLGVRFELGAAASASDIVALHPNEVVLACGSQMVWPRSWPAELEQEYGIADLRRALPDVMRRQERQPGTAVLCDMDHTEGTYAAAELLAGRFERVVLITSRESIAQDVSLVARQGIQRRLFQLGVAAHVLSEVRLSAAFEEATIERVSVFGGEPVPIRDVAFFSYATPRRPVTDLFAPLRAANVLVQEVGDCRSPGTLMAATADGSRIGHAL